MSSPADFWRKIGQQRGVPNLSPNPEKQPSEPAPAQASAPKTSGGSLVFKAPQKDCRVKSSVYASSTYDSTSPVTPSTTASWDDIVAEEEAEAAGYGYDADHKSHEDTSMASTVARQANRIKETEAAVTRQAHRIVELNSQASGHASYIEKLEVAIAEKSARVVELEATATEREARIADLIHQAHEEAHRAIQLEKQLDKKIAIIQELELQVTENVSMPDSDSATEVEVDDGAKEAALPQQEPDTLPVPVGPENLNGPVDPTGTVVGTIDATPAKPAKDQAASPANDDFLALSPVEFPTLGTPTPVRDLRRSPFVTADNIKKVPPPPPARTLKMAIDLSKYHKKPAGGSGKFAYGSRRATEAPPKIDVSKDIRAMSKEEREPFGYGPTVQIMFGNETVAALPKYVFMQVSYKAFKHWTDNPTAATIKFEADFMSKDALNIFLDWMTMHTHCNYVFSVALKKDSSDRYNLELVRCARVLGLHPMYVSQFTRHYCEKMRDGPSKELVALVDELVYTDDDPILDCLANHMAMQRSKVKPEDRSSWDEELIRLPKLARKMQDVQGLKTSALGKTYARAKVC